MAEPSWQDLYDLGLFAAQSARPNLKVEQGDVTDAILAGAATMGTAIIAYAEARFRAAFLDGAEEDDLTALAHDRGVDRDTGSAAIGTVTLTRPSAAAGAGTVDAGTKLATGADETGAFVTIVTDVDAVFGGGDLTKTVTATALEVGKTGNIDAGTLERVLDNIFDPSIVPSNAALFAGGVEEESDEDLRDRVRGFFLTQARGTLDALEFGARQVPGIDRVSIVVDNAGVVTVYVSDADGNANQAMVDAADAELENWRDAADIVNAAAGTIVSTAIDLTLTVKLGVDVNALLDRVRQAVVSAVGRLNPGEILFLDLVQAAARQVDPEAISGVRVNAPLVNVEPAQSQSIRTTTLLVTFS